MRLKRAEDYRPPFTVWEQGVRWVVYDSEEDVPVVIGSSMVVKKFISKYLPPTADIFYFDRTGIFSKNGLVFRWKLRYEGVPEALKGEAKEIQEIEAEKRKEEQKPA